MAFNRILVLLIFSLIAILFIWHTDQAVTQENSVPAAKPSFVSSETCKTCHAERHETWLKTAHAYSLREPSAEVVAGRFDGKPIETRYFTATPFRREGGFWIRVDAKDARPSGEFKISRVIGRTFEQAYLFTGPKGEWRVLPLCWSLERQKWDLTHRVLDDISGGISAGEDFDTREKIFNDGCGQCHATQYDIGYNTRTDSYASKMLEGAVACESCHGPGSAHVAWHQEKQQPAPDYRPPARLLHPKKDLDAKGVLESCGRCHYKHIWRYAIDEDPRVGFNEIAISQNHDSLGFFADGRLSGLNYNGSTQSQSLCFKGGMSCLSCHQMHGGKRWAMRWEENDDAQCAQCHPKLVAAAQPHTHHKEVRCVDCHMPKFLTGVLHTMRDHSMRSPEPELTERFQAANAPNACSNCHQDRPLSWMREWKAKWWKPTSQRMVDNVGLVVDLRRRARIETQRLAATAEDPANGLFFRLTAMRKLAELSDETARTSLRRLLSDLHEEVRQLACAGIAEQPHPEAAAALLKLLEDPVRTVRVEAAYALTRCGWRGSTPAFEHAYSDAIKMLERQKTFDDILERLVPLADASGKNREMAEHLAPLFRNPNRPRTMGDLLQRRGRSLAEEGNHAGALDLYSQAVDQYFRTSGPSGQTLPDLLYIDHAASLHALGRRQEASSDWQQLLAQARPGSVPQLIASARLASLSGVALKETQALEAAVDRLKNEAWAGELLRRARWEINTLSPALPRR